MKTLILILTIIQTFQVRADTNQMNTDHACLQQAIILVKQIKSELYPNMDQLKSDRIVKMAVASCKQQFNNTSVHQTDTDNPGQAESDDDDSNWFTEKILSGETPNKAGNKRLRKMQHK